MSKKTLHKISGIKLETIARDTDNNLNLIRCVPCGSDITKDLEALTVIINREYGPIGKLKFHDFLTAVYLKIDEMNSAGVGGDNGLFCRKFPFWCVVHRDQKTGLLLKSSIEISIAYQGYIPDKLLDKILREGESPSDIKQIYSYVHPSPYENITNTLETKPQETFEFCTSSEKTKGYTVVDIELLRSYINAGEIHRCHWCCKELPAASHRGKSRKFCSDRCKQTSDNFDRMFLKLMRDWKKYSDFIKHDNVNEANELKHNSPYGHLFNEKLNTAEKMYNCGMEGERLLEYYIRQPCLNCGREIPNDRDIRARFCSDTCRDEYHNRKRKQQK